MNFELKALNLGDLSREKCDAVLVLVTNAFNPGKDALSVLIAKAIKEGDLTAKSGQMLDIYRPLGLTCKRLVLIHTGDGATPDVRKAVTAAVALVKSAKPKQIAVFFPGGAGGQGHHLRHRRHLAQARAPRWTR
jgi:leucyl aminopeptidase